MLQDRIKWCGLLILTTTLKNDLLLMDTDAEMQEGIWSAMVPVLRGLFSSQSKDKSRSGGKRVQDQHPWRLLCLSLSLPAPPPPSALPLIAASSQPAAAYKQIFVLSFFFCHLVRCWYFKLAFDNAFIVFN